MYKNMNLNVAGQDNEPGKAVKLSKLLLDHWQLCRRATEGELENRV